MTQRKFANRAHLFDRPAVLFLPASRPSAIAKARASKADMVILDLEDAVGEGDKEMAREAAVDAVAESWNVPVAIRVNGLGTPWHMADVQAVMGSGCDVIVLPLVSDPVEVEAVADKAPQPVVAMIETARGVLGAPAIADVAAALIVGTNDLAADLRLPGGQGRGAMQHAIQHVLLSARAKGVAAFDGVFNRIDDEEGFLAEARESRALGFDGKTLIHPRQIAPCHTAFAPAEADVDRARRLVAAAEGRGGAISFEGEMVEAMHVASARRLLERAGVGESDRT
ncbi:HpcH/HpaI aldolase/citrate lyase family protein [Sphingomicrobium lutaoense]|uniref:Citrate lyase subunit beta/citryl-CoA lyase n=1 Tax=Sphingomicrobium lutaoense TaxID=515949 RepID=A0A839Z2L2_9SPHN|nr:CoA ester lyase [Sphingomicrobium lutaoense]MBB3763825.1 citrate lyase subunit beta/citryl-CoA lyase [Sphingomicrobium lutaoense]